MERKFEIEVMVPIMVQVVADTPSIAISKVRTVVRELRVSSDYMDVRVDLKSYRMEQKSLQQTSPVEELAVVGGGEPVLPKPQKKPEWSGAQVHWGGADVPLPAPKHREEASGG
jgi:hypothetical protein